MTNYEKMSVEELEMLKAEKIGDLNRLSEKIRKTCTLIRENEKAHGSTTYMYQDTTRAFIKAGDLEIFVGEVGYPYVAVYLRVDNRKHKVYEHNGKELDVIKVGDWVDLLIEAGKEAQAEIDDRADRRTKRSLIKSLEKLDEDTMLDLGGSGET